MKSVFIHFSGVFEDEGWGPSGIDLSQLDGTRCYCDSEAQLAISKAIAPVPLKAVHCIDTGDYHYMTALLLQKATEGSISLLLLDNHPDDQAPAFSPDILSCGSWVLEARRNPVITDFQWIQKGDEPITLGSNPIYISIDLDVLSRDYARTNWNQGEMTLSRMIDILDTATKGRELAGVDICGGITLAQGASAEDLAINYRTRKALIDYFSTL